MAIKNCFEKIIYIVGKISSNLSSNNYSNFAATKIVNEYTGSY
jgi:hypothetical protein